MERKPLAFEEVVEHILIPVFEPIRMVLGEGDATGKDILLSPSLQINQQNTGIEIVGIIGKANPFSVFFWLRSITAAMGAV